VASGEPKRAAKNSKVAEPEKKPATKAQPTVRRAIVDVSKPSFFNWTRRPPRGTTIFLNE
jgi:hypothetical protein